ncbi:hypothetical protein F4604DRAFT_1758084 [Suillus subluteus]|nr:hypothetical protein F4604DRAFT_1758084 [Suillus subluteus]
MSIHHALLAAIPITINFATCVLCAASRDWLAFALILLGVISGGTSCFVIGSAQLDFLTGVKEPSPGTPPADGLLLMRNDVVIIRGAEKDINPITKGQFALKMNGGPEYRRIGLCSLLLLAQFLLQLLFIPQASTFGQIMFMSSVAASWTYNSFLSSLEPEKIQLNILWKALDNPRLLKFELKNRAAQAVFACLVLGNGPQRPSVDFKPKKVLQRFLSNDTRVWNVWRDKVTEQLENNKKEKSFNLSSRDLEGFAVHERALLESLLQDARDAYTGYQEWVHRISDNSYISEKQVRRPDSVVQSCV